MAEYKRTSVAAGIEALKAMQVPREEALGTVEAGRKIVVLGTDHRLQGVEKLEAIKKIDDPTYGVLIEKLVRDFSLDYIFEEASGLGPTTASKLQGPGLGYADVDPPGADRQKYGIPRGLPFEKYIIYEINDPRMPKPEPCATKKSVAEEFGREKVWVERINKVSFRNGLMICGATHTFSVASRLEQSGFSVDVILYGVVCAHYARKFLASCAEPC